MNKKDQKPKKCAMCGRTLRYDFEIKNGICETCEIGKRSKVKNYKEFTKK